jgi:hypothetical protein
MGTKQREAANAPYALAASLTSTHRSEERLHIRSTVLDTPPFCENDRLDTRSFTTTPANRPIDDEATMRSTATFGVQTMTARFPHWRKMFPNDAVLCSASVQSVN